MSDLHSRPSVFPWPPVVYICCVALAIILTVTVPLPWLGGTLAEFLMDSPLRGADLDLERQRDEPRDLQP